MSGSEAIQELSLPTCLLTIPCWVYCSTMKRQTARTHTHTHTHTQVYVHTTHLHWQQVSKGQCHIPHSCRSSCLELCVCVWQTGSPCAQTHTIVSLSHHIILYLCWWLYVYLWLREPVSLHETGHSCQETAETEKDWDDRDERTCWWTWGKGCYFHN